MVRNALAVGSAGQELGKAQAAEGRAKTDLDQARAAARDASSALLSYAGDHALPMTALALDEVATALDGAATSIAELKLASELFADPHSPDHTTLLGRGVARVVAASQAVAAGQDPAIAVQAVARAAGWREAWAAEGIACDQVSSTVLVLNVALPGSSGPAGLTRAAAQAGEPLWLTARMLRPGWALPPRIDAGPGGTRVREPIPGGSGRGKSRLRVPAPGVYLSPAVGSGPDVAA